MVQRVAIHPWSLLPSPLRSDVAMVPPSQRVSLGSGTVVTQGPHFTWSSAVFTSCPSSVPGPHPRDHVTCKSPSLPRLPWAPVVSPLFLFFWINFTALKRTCPVFCRMSPPPWGFLKITLLNHLWPLVGLCCCVGCSPVAEGYSLLAVRGLLIAVASLVAQHGSRVRGFGCSSQAQSCSSRAQAQWLWYSG